MEETSEALIQGKEDKRSLSRAPVSIKSEACISVRSSHDECRLCVEACPDDILKLENGRIIFADDDCSKCGVCVAVCPSSVFTLRLHEDSVIYEAIDGGLENSGELKFGCRYTEFHDNKNNEMVVLPCLAMLHETFLIDAAMEGADLLHLSAPCGGCSVKAGESIILRSVHWASSVLSALGSNTSIRFELTDQEPDVDREAAPAVGEYFSRRGFFSEISKTLAREARLGNEENFKPPPGYIKPISLTRKRRRLNDLVKPLLGEEHSFSEEASPFRVLSINENCIGCVACSTSCPTGALSRQEGPESVSILFSAVKCVKCFGCSSVCPEDAFSYMEQFTVDQALAEDTLLFELKRRMCASCEKPFLPEGDETWCRACVKFMKFHKSLMNTNERS